MKYILSLFLLLNLLACGRGFHKKELTVRGFEKQFNAFIEYSKKYGNPVNIDNLNLVIQFGMLPPDKYGYCQIPEDIISTKIIVISSDWWPSLNDTEKEILLLHELFHCVLYKSHDERIFSDGRPYSIMFPYLLNYMFYLNYKDYYLNQGFNG